MNDLNQYHAERLLAIIDDAPRPKSFLRATLNIGEARVRLLLDALESSGQAIQGPPIHGTHRLWHSKRLWESMHSTSRSIQADEGVSFPERPDWTMPAAVVTYVDGVKITRQGAPKGRFHVDMKPGTGVISSDWMQRRA